ncbi:hypothetical protein VTG60DRAFT_1969 [Thermothelomyces hinnuleus]
MSFTCRKWRWMEGRDRSCHGRSLSLFPEQARVKTTCQPRPVSRYLAANTTGATRSPRRVVDQSRAGNDDSRDGYDERPGRYGAPMHSAAARHERQVLRRRAISLNLVGAVAPRASSALSPSVPLWLGSPRCHRVETTMVCVGYKSLESQPPGPWVQNHIGSSASCSNIAAHPCLGYGPGERASVHSIPSWGMQSWNTCEEKHHIEQKIAEYGVPAIQFQRIWSIAALNRRRPQTWLGFFELRI